MSFSFVPSLPKISNMLKSITAVKKYARLSSAAKIMPSVLFTNNIPNTDHRHLKLSDSCVERLKKIATKGTFLRVMVEGGGCSGFQYTFDLDTVIKDDDHTFERDGMKVVVDEMSLQFLSGSTIDYGEELIRSAFRVVNNPQADLGCSCGASFSIKASKSDQK